MVFVNGGLWLWRTNRWPLALALLSLPFFICFPFRERESMYVCMYVCMYLRSREKKRMQRERVSLLKVRDDKNGGRGHAANLR